jgi:hypothetical protein
MLINSIFYTLNSFKKNEWNEFARFVDSPYYVKGKINKNIYKRLYVIFNNKRRKRTVTLETFRDNILQIKEFNGVANQTVKNRLSNFSKILERFLMIREETELRQKSNLLSEYLTRNITDNFKRSFSHFEKSLNNEYVFSDEYDYIQKIYSFESAFQLSRKNMTGSFTAFSEQTNYFVADFLENFFHYTLDLYFEEFYGNEVKKNICKILYDNINISKLIEEIKLRDSDLYTKTLIRYNLLELFYEKNADKYHNEIVKVFFKNETKFSNSFRLSVYNYMESYYTMQINKGNTFYVRTMFDLLKRREKNNLMVDFSKGLFSMNIFNNFISIGLRVNEYGWVEKFINKYCPTLPKDIRDNEYNINKARVNFHKKDYKSALMFLEKADNTVYDKYHFLQSRLRLQVYYELSMIEEAYVEIDKFKHKIKNSKITPGEAKKYTKDFINIYLAFLKTKNNINENNINDVIYILNNTKNIISKDWFLEKISELKNNFKITK